MAEKYAPAEIEAKWQRRWAEARVAYVDTAVPGDEFYMLNMYPVPVGQPPARRATGATTSSATRSTGASAWPAARP